MAAASTLSGSARIGARVRLQIPGGHCSARGLLDVGGIVIA